MKAYFYGRISPRPKGKDLNRDETSIPAQLTACKRYCEASDWEIIHLESHEDVMLSGATMERPGLTACLAKLKKGDALIVYSLSRLARSTLDAIRIADLLQEKGCNLVSVTERIDTSTAMGRLFFTILAAIAQMERELTAERTSAAMRHYQTQGKRMSRYPIYGWKLFRGNMVVDEKALECIAQAKEMRAQGLSWREIAEAVSVDGYSVSHQTLRLALQREVNNG